MDKIFEDLKKSVRYIEQDREDFKRYWLDEVDKNNELYKEIEHLKKLLKNYKAVITDLSK